MQLTVEVQTVGGIISLLNDCLLSNGKPPLGFLNPWLYGDGLAGLKDITSSSNPGYNTDEFPTIVPCVLPSLCPFITNNGRLSVP